MRFLQFLWNVSSTLSMGFALFSRTTAAGYREAVWGAFGSSIVPILAALVPYYGHRIGILQVGTWHQNYLSHAALGILSWQFFFECALCAPRAFVEGQTIFLRTISAPMSMVVGRAFSIFWNFLVRLVVLALALFPFEPGIAMRLPLFLFGSLFLGVLGLAVGNFAVPAYFMTLEGPRLYTRVLQITFFVVPAAYPIATDSALTSWILLNPLSHLLEASRNLALGQPALTGAWFVCVIISLLLLTISLRWLRIAIPKITEFRGWG